MMRRQLTTAGTVVSLALFLSGSGFDDLRSQFARRDYAGVLAPLIDYYTNMDKQNERQRQEVEYMLAQTMCGLGSFRADGCEFAASVGPKLWNGSQSLATADLFGNCCRQVRMLPPCPPGVGGKRDDFSGGEPGCATTDAKIDDPKARGGSRRDVLRDVRSKLPAGTSRSRATTGMVASRAAVGSFEHDTDRAGSDFLGFDLESPDIAQCQAACQADVRCRAWTYVRPGFQGAKARCCLKEAVPSPSAAACCVSGVKP